MPSVPFVRVVVLNWNAPWLTARCLRSLQQTNYPVERFEVVVADNASIDGSLERLRLEFPNVRFVQNDENYGFAEGNNRAMRDLDGVDGVALVNNDATVEPDWLAHLVDAMESDHKIAAVAPRILLETPTVPVRLDAAATIERVCVDGVDVTRRCTYERCTARAHPTAPLVVEQSFRHGAVVNVPVAQSPVAQSPVAQSPVAQSPNEPETAPLIEITLRSDDDSRHVVSERAGSQRDRRINNLGTELTPWTEGSERWFGELDRDHLAVHDVWGFSGGGVLIRTAAIRDVGLFDPTWFAYYEDTDLAWRMRRHGWRIVCAPDAVLHHLHGGSAGPEAAGFFLLNYRNWLLTVLRNGSPKQVLTALRTASKLSWAPTRRNVIGLLRRGRRPHLTLTLSWLRVWAGFVVAAPRVVSERVRRVRPGATPTSARPSRLMPATPPRAPRMRPGGPLVVYVDVTETLRSGWRAGIQRVVTELVRELPRVDLEIDLVALVWSKPLGAFRRLDNHEYAQLLAPTTHQPPNQPAPAPTFKRKVLATVMHRSGLAPVVYQIRRRRELRAIPPHHRALVIDRFEPGSVFFDVDATWNPTTQPRAELLGALYQVGVRTVWFAHDLIPIRHRSWFIPQLADVFTEHVDAHLNHESFVLANSEYTAHDVAAYADETARLIHVESVPLGATAVAASATRPDAVADFLIVGTIEPRKGHRMVLEAFAKARSSFGDARLIVAGRGGWNDDGLLDRLRAGIDGVEWRESVSDDELDTLYRSVGAVIVASVTEGFGLPVIEALQRCTPVLSSNGGALREAGGDAADYFDPSDPDELAALMERFLGDEHYRTDLQRRADEFTPPTWSDAARAVAAALHRAAHATTGTTP